MFETCLHDITCYQDDDRTPQPHRYHSKSALLRLPQRPQHRIHDRYLHLSFFFFSSRRRHTRLQGDWSSDVCSSDLEVWPGGVGREADARVRLPQLAVVPRAREEGAELINAPHIQLLDGVQPDLASIRSEERRVGKECRSRWSPYH